ncbi:tRNA (adenosine(37)-N6)-dimethylallyltransferase MiaA [Pyramidobacter piscolens]|uniref:tRNA (adenosine(37)-N6)-dimethylallyltransferase MiaA n=1 Tax=Pyramidobacter piscolens TaxID=638849 RepID=UPI0026E0741E|nr:tRNA (adenosine(37)-N6)-dimethylallyltransferase MiaA [Pyramidobacter piscolens]
MSGAKKTPIVAVIGPTAVGKTAMSLGLARALNAEVISVDSRQVYRYMDVGTDKISREVRREIPHHLIDVADPDQVYTASDFTAQAADCVRRIIARGRAPLFVGGTPFYYQALFSRLLSIDVPTDEKLRAELFALEADELYERLRNCDPESAVRLHPNDKFRVSRALEIFLTSGRPASDWYARERPAESPYDVLYLGLFKPRDLLVGGIERRVRQQFSSGYPEEVKWLLDHGYSPDLPSMQGFGYRELVLFHQGRMTLEEAIMGDVIATRQFAKRQMTWFKKFAPAVWCDLSQKTPAENGQWLLDQARKHLDEALR